MSKKFLAVLSLVLSTNAFSWADLGHSTVGHIAEKNLSPEGRSFMNSILGGEPMAVAAIWPDQVRDDSRFDAFAPYHFFEIPEGMTSKTIPKDQFPPKSAETILGKGKEALQIKRRGGLSLTQKQIIMRYFIHVVGDIHQPLHVGNGLDRGANLCDVKIPDAVTGKLYTSNLHSVWDGGIISHIKEDIIQKAKEAKKPIKYFSHVHLGDAIIEEAQTSGWMKEYQELATKTDKHDWYMESRNMHGDVYPSPAERPYCKLVNLATGKIENGKYDMNEIPEVSKEYMIKSIAIIKKRLILAGLRLAQEINTMALSTKSKAWDKKKEEEFFKKMLLEDAGRAPSSTTKKLVPEITHDWCHDEH
jgi:hypothetical protein